MKVIGSSNERAETGSSSAQAGQKNPSAGASQPMQRESGEGYRAMSGHLTRSRALPGLFDLGSWMPRTSPELDPDGAQANVTEGSLSPEGEGRDLIQSPSEIKSIAVSPAADDPDAGGISGLGAPTSSRSELHAPGFPDNTESKSSISHGLNSAGDSLPGQSPSSVRKFVAAAESWDWGQSPVSAAALSIAATWGATTAESFGKIECGEMQTSARPTLMTESVGQFLQLESLCIFMTSAFDKTRGGQRS